MEEGLNCCSETSGNWGAEVGGASSNASLIGTQLPCCRSPRAMGTLLSLLLPLGVGTWSLVFVKAPGLADPRAGRHGSSFPCRYLPRPCLCVCHLPVLSFLGSQRGSRWCWVLPCSTRSFPHEALTLAVHPHSFLPPSKASHGSSALSCSRPFLYFLSLWKNTQLTSWLLLWQHLRWCLRVPESNVTLGDSQDCGPLCAGLQFITMKRIHSGVSKGKRNRWRRSWGGHDLWSTRKLTQEIEVSLRPLPSWRCALCPAGALCKGDCSREWCVTKATWTAHTTEAPEGLCISF